MTTLDFLFVGCCGNRTESSCNLRLIEEHTDLIHLTLVISAIRHLVGGSIESADNLVLRCLAAYLIVRDAETNHVHTHIRWRLIGILTIDTLEERIQNGEDLYVAIVVHSRLVVCFQMEWVDHVYIVEISRSSLISDIHRMLQGQVPHGEGLELGITSTDTTLVLIIEL